MMGLVSDPFSAFVDKFELQVGLATALIDADNLDPETVAPLLNMGASDDSGAALYRAARAGNVPVVKMLLEHIKYDKDDVRDALEIAQDEFDAAPAQDLQETMQLLNACLA
jgi:ankyrin repeat protein